MFDPSNSPEYWDAVFAQEGENSFRLYPRTAREILARLPAQSRVVEFGGGPGIMAKTLQVAGHYVVMFDHSIVAVNQARARGVENAFVASIPEEVPDLDADFVMMAEFLEHFDKPETIVERAVEIAPNAFYVVPNDFLGPEELKEHHQKFTRDSLMVLLAPYYRRITIDTFSDMWEYKSGFVERKFRVPLLLADCRERIERGKKPGGLNHGSRHRAF